MDSGGAIEGAGGLAGALASEDGAAAAAAWVVVVVMELCVCANSPRNCPTLRRLRPSAVASLVQLVSELLTSVVLQIDLSFRSHSERAGRCARSASTRKRCGCVMVRNSLEGSHIASMSHLKYHLCCTWIITNVCNAAPCALPGQRGLGEFGREVGEGRGVEQGVAPAPDPHHQAQPLLGPHHAV